MNKTAFTGRSKELVGLVLVVLGVQCSVLANTTAKLLSEISLFQMMHARFIMQWFCSMSLGLILKARGHNLHLTGSPGQRKLLSARAAAYTSAIGCLWCALRAMPVGEATAIVYLHPILCGIMACYFYGEQLKQIFWIQAAFSCIGVVLVSNLWSLFDHSKKQSDSTAPAISIEGVTLAILSCCCFAAGNCLVRSLQGISPLEIQIYTDTLVAWVVMPVLLASTDQLPFDEWSYEKLKLLVCFTVFGLSTSVLAITGFQLAKVSTAALFMYMEVPSAFAMQVFYFHEALTRITAGGACLITFAAIARLLFEAFTGGEPPDYMVSTPLASPLASPLLHPFSPLTNPKMDDDLLTPLSLPPAHTDQWQ